MSGTEEATQSEWKVLWDDVDATGDDLPDAVIQHELRQVRRIPGCNKWDCDSLVYMNADATIKMVATPYWSVATGETFTLCVSRAT